MKNSIIENKLVRLHFRGDNILHLHYLTTELNLTASKDILSFTREHSPWKISPLLITGDEFMNQDKESLSFNASKEVLQYCSAFGFITDSVAKKILANFYMTVNRGKIPMRFFSNEADAAEWLAQFPTVKLEVTSLENTKV